VHLLVPLAADLEVILKADREADPAVEALVIPPQVMAILVMALRTTVRVVAGLAVALHMPLIVASRPEASLE
jgi:hypothetical protein